MRIAIGYTRGPCRLTARPNTRTGSPHWRCDMNHLLLGVGVASDDDDAEWCCKGAPDSTSSTCRLAVQSDSFDTEAVTDIPEQERVVLLLCHLLFHSDLSPIQQPCRKAMIETSRHQNNPPGTRRAAASSVRCRESRVPPHSLDATTRTCGSPCPR